MSQFEFIRGNIFDSSCEALVNPVNLLGVSGKGLALQFKFLFPENFKFYRQECLNKNFNIGKLLFFVEKNKIIINFPTKTDYWLYSKYEYIECGIKTLRKELLERQIKSVAIPKLGCGEGGLEWDLVKKIILSNLTECDISFQIYE